MGAQRGQFGGSEAGIEVGQNQPGASRPEVRGHIVKTGFRADGGMMARGQPFGGQGAGHPFAGGGQLPIGETALRGVPKNQVWRLQAPPFDELADQHRPPPFGVEPRAPGRAVI